MPRAALDQHRSVCSKGCSGRGAFPGSRTCSVLTDLANGTRGQSCLPSAYPRQGKKIPDFQAASEFSTILSNIKSLLICKSHPTYFHLEVTSTGINEPTESLHFLTLMVFTKTGRPPGVGQPLPTLPARASPGSLQSSVRRATQITSAAGREQSLFSSHH